MRRRKEKKRKKENSLSLSLSVFVTPFGELQKQLSNNSLRVFE
jgi:hypothetical protein